MKLLNLRGGDAPLDGLPPVAQSGGQRDQRSNSRKKKREKTPTRREMLALRPLRNPELEWAVEDGQVVLQIKRNKTNWKMKLLNVFVPVDALPDKRPVVLDPIGTDVWQMIDGEATIEYITKALVKKYKLTPREAELSLQQFFKELGRRGYVGFLINDQQADFSPQPAIATTSAATPAAATPAAATPSAKPQPSAKS